MKTISASSHSSDGRKQRRILHKVLLLPLVCSLLLSGCFREASPRPSLLSPDSPQTNETAGTADIRETAGSPETAPTAPPETDSSDTQTAETDSETPPDPALYFQNTLFVGDSILEGVARYVRAQRKEDPDLLANASFLTDTSGIRTADLLGDITDGRILYLHKGKAQELSVILSDRKPDRVILFLGMNDLAWGFTVRETVERYDRLLTSLSDSFPDMPVTVMTVTPKIASSYLPWYCRNPEFDSELLNTLAAELRALCEKKQIPCMDANAALRDESGNLPADYCSDGYVHLSTSGAAALTDALEKFAVQELSKS